jgi:hypothetical protein
MRTSPDEDESETLFPSANEPNLGEENIPSTMFPNELSPPASQDPPVSKEWEGVRDESMDLGPQDAPDMARSKDSGERKGIMHGLNSSSSLSLLEEDYEPSGMEHEPGYAWRNAKAVEEHRRAKEQVLDDTFNLSRRLISTISKLKI